MTIEQTPLEDCFVINEKVHGDSRGYFIETYNKLIKHNVDFHFLVGVELPQRFVVIMFWR